MTTDALQPLLPFELAYTPVYYRSPQIEEALAVGGRDRWRFENLILDSDYLRWFQERALIRRVHSSTTIEGNRLNEDQAARLLRGEDIDADEKQKREVLNLKTAMDFVDEVAPDPVVPLDEQVICQINRLILQGESPTMTPGVYRLGQNLVRDPIAGGIAYTPPVSGDVPSLMRQFGLWLRRPHEESEAPVVAGIAHLRLVEIHPFWDGNGRTARALEALVLQRYGWDFNGLLSPERQFVWELRRYFQQLSRTVGGRFQEGRDLTDWLDYLLLTLSMEIQGVGDQLAAFRQFLESMQAQLRPRGLKKRQIDLLVYLYINGRIRFREYAHVFSRSRETLRRDLALLTESGLIDAHGRTRGRWYEMRAEALAELMEAER